METLKKARNGKCFPYYSCKAPIRREKSKTRHPFSLCNPSLPGYSTLKLNIQPVNFAFFPESKKGRTATTKGRLIIKIPLQEESTSIYNLPSILFTGSLYSRTEVSYTMS